MTKKNTSMIVLAYALMIIIWSTTPLAIKWSSQGVSFIAGVSLRMLIGALLACLLALIWYRSIPMHKAAQLVYISSASSIYGAMMLVYWGAQFVSSGLISVLYGLSPIFTAGFAIFLVRQEVFRSNKLLGAILGGLGLSIIFIDQISLNEHTGPGIAAILGSVIVHSISAVWIKKLNVKLPALLITAGGLLYATPLFILSFVLFADPLPEVFPTRAIWSIVYLGIMGSVVGFASYYYVLARLNASTVALATLITPVAALILGLKLNHESLNTSILMGSGCILSGLLIHQYFDFLLHKKLS